MDNFGRLHRVEVISNRGFLEMSLIASAFPINLSSTGSGGTFTDIVISMKYCDPTRFLGN